jgi:hypothetical protein
MKIHELKLEAEFFFNITTGVKTCEIRKNDRNYEIGDTLILYSWLPKEKRYSGEPPLFVIITDITKGYGLKNGYVALSIKKIKK